MTTSISIAAERTMKVNEWWTKAPEGLVNTSRAGDIVRADALTALQGLLDCCIDVVFLDPPFNLGKDYGESGKAGDSLGDADYHTYMTNVLREATRILKPGGALYLYHIPKWALRFTRELGESLEFRHWIAIAMKNGYMRGKGLYPAHYALLYFTKGPPSVANRPKIQPATCPHCDEYVKDYGGYTAKVANGVNLSDFWDDLSPVRHSKYKNRGANELPLLLVKRVLAISGQRGGVLLDPFAGTGTSIIAARLKKMRYIAIDRELANCQLMATRIQNVTAPRRSKHTNEV
ncbi:MAG TPA: site-specific DNA-methyltransferase [Longimicrobium sp.]